MRGVEKMQKADWPAILSRATGVALLLVDVLLAAGLCVATPHDNSVPNIFDSHFTPADSIRHLSFFVLSVTGLIFLVVFSLLTYAVVKFRSRASDTEREPAQVYPYRVENGLVTIQAGQLPTPGSPTASLLGKKPACGG